MQNSPKKSSDRDYYMFAARVFGDFTGMIAVPALLGAILGRYLDDKFDKEPLFLAICLVIAFAGSATVVYRKVKTYAQEYQKLTGAPKDPSKKE